MTKRKIMIWISLASLVVWIGIRWGNEYMRPAHRLGVLEGELADCPDWPNCVSTQTSNAEHHIEPIPLNGSAERAVQSIKAILRKMPRTQIVAVQERYLHAECRSLLLGFVDDVEFFIDESNGLIHYRAASRVGRSDLGVNRHRMEQIRSQLQLQ